jgi:GNAT superfamily N-acetyltransferase
LNLVLPAFPPAATSEWLDNYPGPQAPGISLRRADDSDVGFFRDLYAQSRANEVAAMPWPQATKRSFCDSQFTLQHSHYVAQHPHGYFLVVQFEDFAIGRLYLCRQENELWLIDILLEQAWRGRGLGSALLNWMQGLAVNLRLNAVRLHVLQHNMGARRLYERHGFLPEASEGAHLHMIWPCTQIQHDIVN